MVPQSSRPWGRDASAYSSSRPSKGSNVWGQRATSSLPSARFLTHLLPRRQNSEVSAFPLCRAVGAQVGAV